LDLILLLNRERLAAAGSHETMLQNRRRLTAEISKKSW
jgi:hypothetical protein